MDTTILEEMKKFLGETRTCFLMPDCEEQVEGVLRTIVERTPGSELTLSYLSLPLLLHRLLSQDCPTLSIAERQLDMV